MADSDVRGDAIWYQNQYDFEDLRPGIVYIDSGEGDTNYHKVLGKNGLANKLHSLFVHRVKVNNWESSAEIRDFLVSKLGRPEVVEGEPPSIEFYSRGERVRV